jgi:hypothetical protein
VSKLQQSHFSPVSPQPGKARVRSGDWENV